MAKIDRSQPVTWVEVDLSAIRHNIREVKRITKGLPLMPVIKANAYGHGLVPVAKACENIGVEYLAVVSCEEALELRRAGITLPILVLAYVGVFLPKHLVVDAIKQNVEFAVFDIETAHFLSSMATRVKKKVRIHMKVDTGTTRMGMYPREFIGMYEKIQALKNVQVVGVFTHFAQAEETLVAPTTKQVNSLRKIQKELTKKEKSKILFHAACSAALMKHKNAFFDMGRLGISLYGLWPDPAVLAAMKGQVALKPALMWKTKVIQVKRVKKGTKVGYGGTYTAPRDIIIAVIAVGYADGFDRKLSNKGTVLVNGQKAPIRGRICMNVSMVEVTGIERVHPGTKVTLIGSDGGNVVSADDMAKICGTINYETVTRINWALPRFYKK